MAAAPIFTITGKILFYKVDILPVFWGVIGSFVFIVLGMMDKKKINLYKVE